MNKIIVMAAALLVAGAAQAQTAPQSAPIQDRIAELCAVSNTDLEGHRLAKACRAEVRAEYEAQRIAARTAQRSVRTAANDTGRPR